VRLSWPLTGRSEELRLINTALSGSDAAGIVVVGAAGVGKSRVARAGLDAAMSTGCSTRWAVGTSSARALPLGAFSTWAWSADDTLQLVRGVIEALTSAPRGTAVVVGVDDAHLLDDLSIFVLQQIIRRRAAKVVLTVRAGEPIPPGLQEIWKEGGIDRLDLQPLSRDETTVLVSAALKGSVDTNAARQLWTLTRGNVLYLVNIVEQEIAAGRLIAHHGRWRWVGEPVMPPGLVELVESRIGELPPAVGDVVDALAIGEPLDLALLCSITEAAAVEEAEMRGLITLESGKNGPQARVAHPLYGEVRRERAALVRLRRLRGLVAAELAESDDADDAPVVVRRATLSLDSDRVPDPDLLLRAALGAVWLADLPLADRLAEAAIRAGAPLDARVVRAHTLMWLSRGDEIDALFDGVHTSELTTDNQGAVVFLRATNKLWTLADPSGARELIEAASRTLPAEARWCINAFLAIYWAAFGIPEQSLGSAQHVDLDRVPALAGAAAAWGITLAAGDAGRTSQAVESAQTGSQIAAHAYEAAPLRYTIIDNEVGALVQAGAIAQALECAERLRREAADLPGSAQLLSLAVGGRAALGAGRLDTARRFLEQAVDLFAASAETIGLTYRYQPSLAIALAMLGSADQAVPVLAALEKTRHPSWRCVDYEEALARAWVAASKGELTHARTTLSSAARTMSDQGRFAAEVMCLQAAAQLGDHSGERRLRGLTALVEGPRAALAARLSAGLRTRDGAELATVSAEFERIGDLVAALDAAAHAARAYRGQSMSGSAYGCTARAEELARRCGGACTPALLLSATRLPFTSREREVAVLIAAGLSNRTIAARLTVSIRTVESHIYRAMAKTGAASREDLAAMLPRRQPGLDQ
jgi:DNA-binding CsgD family transcriptional regulator